MNTVLRVGDGVMRVWVDGNLQFDYSNIVWKKSGSSIENGWNMIGIGGNTTNWFADPECGHGIRSCNVHLRINNLD
jgi:hypothetical protein